MEQLTIAQLRTKVVRLLTSNLKPTSRFYHSDVQDIKAATARKDRKELIATLNRWNYEPSDAEMRRHCQFDGLI